MVLTEFQNLVRHSIDISLVLPVSKLQADEDRDDVAATGPFRSTVKVNPIVGDVKFLKMLPKKLICFGNIPVSESSHSKDISDSANIFSGLDPV